MDITSLIIEAVSGAVGGNIAGAAMKENSLGTVGNSIAGILGGGLGGTILHSVMGPPRQAAVEWIFKVFLPTSVAAGSAARFSWPSSALSRTRWPRSSEAGGSGRRLERTPC